MKYVFSYVLFGTDSSYFDPLCTNIKIINDYFESSLIYVYVMMIPEHWKSYLETCDCVVVKEIDLPTNSPATFKMIQRYRVVNEKHEDDVCFLFRDTDSFITPPELKIIEHWSKSDYEISVIRDHPEHVMPLMGGLLGCKGNGATSFLRLLNLANTSLEKFNNYAYDQVFLDKHIYKKMKKKILVYSSCCVFIGENVVDITSTLGTIGGYASSAQLTKRKFTLPSVKLFRLLGYRGSRFRISGWYGVNIVGKIEYMESF